MNASICRCSLLLLASLLLSGLLIARIHNIETVQAAKEMLDVSQAPLLQKRCIPLNSTHAKCLPNVFLIGASKAGSTSLFHTLLRHPNIKSVGRRKRQSSSTNWTAGKTHSEIHRFDRPLYAYSIPLIELLSEYASSPAIPVEESDSTILIHYTPHYLYAPSVPFELRELLTRAQGLKFIVILRDPIERAESSYWFKKSRLFQGVDTGSLKDFDTSIDVEIKRRKQYDECMRKERRKAGYSINLSDPGSLQVWSGTFPTVSDGSDFRTAEFIALQKCFGSQFRSSSNGLRHIDKGVYADQIFRWAINFRRQQFYFLRFEDIIVRPEEELTNLFAFLGVSNRIPAHPVQSINGLAESPGRRAEANKMTWHLKTTNKLRENLSATMLVKLHQFYEPYEVELHGILNRI